MNEKKWKVGWGETRFRHKHGLFRRIGVFRYRCSSTCVKGWTPNSLVPIRRNWGGMGKGGANEVDDTKKILEEDG